MSSSFPENQMLRSFVNFLVYVIMVLAGIVFLVFGPRVESTVYPPVSAFVITEQEIIDGDYYIAGYLDKTRGQCKPEDIVIRVGSLTEDSYDKIVDVDFRADPASPAIIGRSNYDQVLTQRPSGVQDWGPWRLIPREPPVGPLASITAIHRCHMFWTVETVIWQGLTEELFPGLYNSKGDFNDILSREGLQGEASGSASNSDKDG